MIKINLLPLEGKARRRKKAAAPVPATLLFIILVFIISAGAALFMYIHLSGKVTKMKKEKAQKDVLLADLKKKIGDVDKLEQKLKKIEDNKKVIMQLRAAQSVPVKVLDELSKLLPDNVWFNKLNISDNKIAMDGTAFTNDDVVIFVENLKNSKLFKDTTLRRATGSSTSDVNVVSYSIELAINTEEPKDGAAKH
ncbi:MAG: PilN domain-containing protein [Nitrospirae bacterium YQR-1]